MTNIHPINALGDPTRRQIFERIRQSPCSVTELVETVSVSQPAVSQHLKVLREAQLVSVVKQGQKRIYQLNPNGLQELRRYVEGLWDDALQAFEAEAEKMANATNNDE
jgi:DNA-binding transcriptional ArsR family regulator